jgi:hypothetical protein
VIHNDEQFRIIREQIGHMESVILSWRKQLLPHNPRNYALYAEGAVEMYWKLRLELDEYLGFHTQIPEDVRRWLEDDADPAPESAETAEHEAEALRAK